jgi:ELP3 family radical SAM enzyme/protein acetyltransferase
MTEYIPIKYLNDFLYELEDYLHKNKDDLFEKPNGINQLHQIITVKLQNKHKVHYQKSEFVKSYQYYLDKNILKPNTLFEAIIRVRDVRTASGVEPCATALPGKGISCKFNCHYCPYEQKSVGGEYDISRSYLSSEGTFKRGLIEDFDGFRQTIRRLFEYESMGHVPDKIEHILLGGTFHSYDEEVRDEYIHNLFYACNIFYELSVKFEGKYSKEVKNWFLTKPFLNNKSVIELQLIISQLRPRLSFEEEKRINETVKCGRIIGIVIETRPDQIGYMNILGLRKYGCTRVQLGIQHIDENILKIINRGHKVDAVKKSIMQLRDNGFKIDGHLMPDLPGTTIEKDMKMLENVFCGEDMQLDYCKIYMCLDVPFTEIRKWKHRAIEMINQGKLEEVNNIKLMMERGDFVGLNEMTKENGHEDIKDIFVWMPNAEYNYDAFLPFLVKSLTLIPPWTRLNRFQRDFPEASIANKQLGYISSNLKTNQQQICMDKLNELGLKCYDIRSREVRNRIILNLSERARLFIRCYRANNGTEFFITVEVPNKDALTVDDAIILGLCRLRVSDWDLLKEGKCPYWRLNEFKNKSTAIIRELHVYGSINAVNNSNHKEKSQHKGIGKFLISVAEIIAKNLLIPKIAIISGVGVRDYYRKLGYYLNIQDNSGEYMFKTLNNYQINELKLFDRDFDIKEIKQSINGLKIIRKLLKKVDKDEKRVYHNYEHIGDSQLVIIKGYEMNKNEKLFKVLLFFILFIFYILFFLTIFL